MTFTLLAAVVAALALLATALLTPVVRGAAIAMGLVRGVRADRWHTRPTPAVGGVAIFGGFAVALAAAYPLWPDSVRGLSRVLPGAGGWGAAEGLLLGATIVFLLGLADDIVQFRPATKLAGQVAAAAILVLSGIGLDLTGSAILDPAISIVWFVGITNALNLLDNMDGLAAGVAAIAGAYLTVLFVLDGNVAFVILSLAMTGSALGFLLHNYPPARIFMGDAGSLFLGLFLAGLALSPGQGLSRSLLAVVAVPALVLAIPILDTTVVTLGRVLEGRPVTEGGKDHTSHRLVSLGLPEERAVWILWGLAFLGGGMGLLFRAVDRTTALLLGGITVVGLVLLGAYLLSTRFRALRSEGGDLPLLEILLALHARFPVLILLLDALLVTLAYFGAYLLRWSPGELPAELAYFRASVVAVVAAKLLAFGLAGLYNTTWSGFGVEDLFRVGRATVLGSLAAVAALFLLERTGLSRGVLGIDLLLTGFLLVLSRASFRVLEGTARRLSREGTPAVLLGDLQGALDLVPVLEGREHGLRPVGLADPDFEGLRSRVAGLPLFGGANALVNAVHDTRATAVVLHGDGDVETHVDAYLAHEGALDVYRLRLEIERVSPGTGGAASGGSPP